MGNVTIKIPLVTWRDGRPRYWPSAKQRKLGFTGEDLRHGPYDAKGRAAGPWFSLDEAIAWSRSRVEEIAAREASIAAGATTARREKNAGIRRRRDGLVTVGQIATDFCEKNPRMQGKPIEEGRKKRQPLAANTVRSYKGSARLLENFDEGRVWNEAAAAVTGKALTGILDRVEVRHGLAQARALRAFLSVTYAYALGRTVTHNPVADLTDTLPVLETDVRPATVAEYLHLVAVCDCLGFPDVADMIVAGAWTGQRQNDRLAMTERQITPDGLLIEPHKKKRFREKLLLPIAPQLMARIEAARARRRDWRVNALELFVCDATRRPWEVDWYRKCFRVLKIAAATGAIETNAKTGEITKEARTMFGTRDIAAELTTSGLKPMPSLMDFADKHARDTCLSWLALAGADKLEIAGFSGHAFGHQERILKHYVAVPPEFARRGMVKLQAWYQEQTEAIALARKAKV